MVLLLAAIALVPPLGWTQEPLSSWNDTPNRSAILQFIEDINTPGPTYVSPADRIAVFDLDGTLLCEKPDYVTALVSHAMLRKRLTDNPALRERPVYRALAEGDTKYLKKQYKDVHLEAFAGLSHREMHAFVRTFLATQYHPVFSRPYEDMVYAPMLELIRLLEARQFKVFVVSASMQEFIRAFSEPSLGIPRERVIGSAVAFSIDSRTRPPQITREREWLEPYNNGPGKAARILERAGRPPILACGNGNGDVDMLNLAAGNPLPHLVLVVDHDDDERDIEYHKPFLLKVAASEDWKILRVSEDFKEVFAPLPAGQDERKTPQAEPAFP